MAKYEIMLIVNGLMKEPEANQVLNESKNLLKKAIDLKVTTMGLRDLAYPIKKVNKGFYFVLNFSNEDPIIIAEFRRVTLLNKNVLRHLIINLEKDYAYKATINPKKVKRSKFRAERFKRIEAAVQAEHEKVRVERDYKPVKLTDI